MFSVRKSGPYVSILFANRNDNYGGNQSLRIRKFISYYADICSRFPNIFEFIICDWNPPPNRPSLERQFDWSGLSKVKHISVSPTTHNKIGGKRKIYDYFARNTCARHSSADWCIVLNQDIYISPGIIDVIARRALNQNFFYRADRIDFNLGDINKVLNIENIEEQARLGYTNRHYRAHTAYCNIQDLKCTKDNFLSLGTYPFSWETIDEKNKIIYQDAASISQLAIVKRVKEKLREFNLGQRDIAQDFEVHNLSSLIGMHTNASGDFILVPTSKYIESNGFPETTKFYMHTDSYFVAQLMSLGLGQASFAQERCVYHLNHETVDHYASENISWPEHALSLTQILTHKNYSKFNTKNWGSWDKI